MPSGPLDGAPTTNPVGGKSAWRELELWLLVGLAAAIYFSRLTDLTIRGEESRWARVAQEMIDSGDWVVPRQQGVPFPDRPPLNSWLIIAASKLTGQIDLAAIRLPSVLATVLTSVLIYVYARSYLSRNGAFASAAAFATMAQVLQLGRMAESDAILTFCVTAALFSWHHGYACLKSSRVAWIAGYALAALSGLAKGPQGPVYFVAITAVFLCLRRDRKFLLCSAHLAGVVCFAIIVGAWQLPFYLALDAQSAQAVWSEGGDVGVRFQYASLGRAIEQWISYPFEVLVCMLPWSCMLIVLASRWFWRNVGSARPMALFLITACAVAFPSCWLPASSRARYFMSLYPCLAPLVGLVVERCWASPQVGWWPKSWDRYLLFAVAIIPIGGVVVCGTHFWGGAFELGQAVTTPFAILYAVAAAGAVAAIFWSRKAHDERHALAGIFSTTAFVGLTYAGVVVNLQMRSSNDPSGDVAAARQMIPPGQRLVSFDQVHHLFAFYYQEPIELHKLPSRRVPFDASATYFCYFESPDVKPIEIPFAWDRLAVISCERIRSASSVANVVIGKRRATPHEADASEQAAARTPSSFFDLDATAAQILGEDSPFQD